MPKPENSDDRRCFANGAGSRCYNAMPISCSLLTLTDVFILALFARVGHQAGGTCIFIMRSSEATDSLAPSSAKKHP